jgi:nitric oxide dioxygenase
MTPAQITLVQESFDKVSPVADAVAALFYGRLFQIAPEVAPLFKGDMIEQGRKLMATLAVVVRGLDDLGELLPTARRLAVKHVEYGVTADQYGPVGTALLWTLSQGLGDEFTPETEAAWSEAYGALSGAMVAAAYVAKAA